MTTPLNWLTKPVIGNARVRQTLEEIERRGRNFKPFYRPERESTLPEVQRPDLRSGTESS